MGILDIFKKAGMGQKTPKKDEKKKERTKAKKIRGEELKKKQFQAVPAAGKEKVEKKELVKSPAAASEKGKKEKGVEAKRKIDKNDTKQAPLLLIKPLITEKATALGALNQYVVAVSPKANKTEIKKAIISLYGIKPVQVNVLTKKGRQVRYGRNEGRTKHWKKAIITLKPGEKIDFYNV